MLRKVLLTNLLGVIMVNSLIGQHQSANQNYTNAIDFLPPSPNVASIVKSAAIATNKNTGSPNIAIPIYTAKGRNLSTNISLSYNSNGIKVDEVSGRVGMGWSINAGGVITRVVRNKPDEENTIIQPWNGVGYNHSTANYVKKVTEKDELQTGGHESEPDLFHYSFDGYSGSFYFNNSNQLIQIQQSGLKISSSFTNSMWTFRIVTPNGNTYFFGGTTATEKSKKSQICQKSFNKFMATAWFLTKAQHSTGEVIQYSYQPLTYTYDNGVYQNSGRYIQPSEPIPGEQPPLPSYQHTVCHSIIETQTYLLKTISTIKDFISFDYIDRQDIQYDKLISQINVPNKTIKLRYETIGANMSFQNQIEYGFDFTPYLKSVTEKVNYVLSGADSMVHKFYYYNQAGRPPRLSFSQDHWGYFNGVVNTSFIPKIQTPGYAQYFPTLQAYREVNFDATASGILTKVVYPTGGIDSIIYEQNALDQTATTPPSINAAQHSRECSVQGTGFSTEKSTEFFVTVGTSVPSKFYIDAQCLVVSQNGSYDPTHNKASITVHNSSNGQEFYKLMLANTVHSDSLLLPSGTYKVVATANGAAIKNIFQIRFFATDYTLPTDTKKLVGGLRVKAVISKSKEKDFNQKIFKYSYLNDLSKSSLTGINFPFYEKFTKMFVSQGAQGYTYDVFTVSSSSTHNIFPFSGSNISYASVVEANDEYLENGATETTFLTSKDLPGNAIWGYNQLNLSGTFDNTASILNGKVAAETVYKKDGTTFTKVSKKKNYYIVDSLRDYSAYMINRACTQNEFYYNNIDTTCAVSQGTGSGGIGQTPPLGSCGYSLSMYLACFDIYKYNIISSKTNLAKTEEIVYNPTASDSILTKTIYHFDNKSYLDNPTSVVKYDSKGDKDSVIFSYAFDKTTAPYTTMVANNTVDKAIGVEQLKLGNSVKDETNYTAWSTGVIEAASFTKTVNGLMSTEGQILQRNALGNILEYRGKDGILYSIFWDYTSTVPLIKAENLSYSALVSALGSNATTLQSFTTTADALLIYDALRNSQPTVKFITYTYSYNGKCVETITDVNRKTNTYTYDNFFRLIAITDHNGSVRKVAEYQYEGETNKINMDLYLSDAQGATFYSQLCSNGYTPSPYSFSVPANIFYSVQSKDSANTKALRYLNEYGQANANKYGLCVSSTSGCTGVNKKVINCLCETGIKVYTNSIQQPSGLWNCTYHYEWSDGTWSQNYIESSPTSCTPPIIEY